jgi:hypothetical protein
VARGIGRPLPGVRERLRGAARERPHAGDPLAVAERSAAICAHELGGTLVSVILHGSLTLGDYVRGRSDVDLLAIVERPLRDEERERLARVVAEQPVTRAPLDLRVVTAAAAARPTEAPPMELYLRHEPPSAPAVERRSPGEPDLVVELSVCREHGRSLCGPAPSELIGEVPHEGVLSYGDSLLALTDG